MHLSKLYGVAKAFKKLNENTAYIAKQRKDAKSIIMGQLFQRLSVERWGGLNF